MKTISCLVLFFISMVTCGKLDSTYLPPNSARGAGGNENILNTPIGDQDNFKYTIASSVNNHEPSPVYGPAHHDQSFERQNNNIHNIQRNNPEPSPVYGPAHHDQFERYNNIQRSNPEARANLIKFDNDNDGNGNYHFDFETENRIHHEEHGQLKQVAGGEAVVVQGSYSYIGDDGKTYTVTYIADENGFQPAGEHINEDIVKTASEAARLSVSDGHNGYANGGNEGVNVKSENVNGGYQY